MRRVMRRVMRRPVVLTALGVVASLALLTTFFVEGAFGSGARRATPAASKSTITFIVYTDPSVQFFVPAVRGARDAAKLFGLGLNVQYGNSDAVTENNEIQTAMARKTSGIAVSVPDNQAYTKTICAARKAGIPVVSWNVTATSGAAHSCIMAFMGQDFVAAGELIAQRMIKDYGIKRGDLVFTPVEAPTATYAVQRYAGVKKALAAVGAHAELLGTGFNLADVQTKETQYLLGHRNVKAIIALGSAPLTEAPKAISQVHKKIPIGGFDLTPDIIKAIKSGTIDATVDQQPYSQGFYAVAQLALYLKYGLFPSDMATGGRGLVDKSNVGKVAALAGTIR